MDEEEKKKEPNVELEIEDAYEYLGPFIEGLGTGWAAFPKEAFPGLVLPRDRKKEPEKKG